MSRLAFRAAGVARGDVTVIRWIGADHAAEDRSVGLTFVAVLIGTVHEGLTTPFTWFMTAALTSTVGVAAFAAVAWLIGRSLDGGGTYRAFVRTSGFAIGPVALGFLFPGGIVIGLVAVFVATVAITRALHSVDWVTSALAAVLPVMVIVAAITPLISR